MNHDPGDDVSRETGSHERQRVVGLDRNLLDPLLLWLGVPLSEDQRVLLDRFTGWLCTEAVAAGAIGPGEVPRIFDRHIADSLVYLTALGPGGRSIVDVGSGAGLPGIPLAIAQPSSHFTLVDRSSKRSDLALRAVRILDLENVDVRTAEARDLVGMFDGAVFRASLPVAEATEAYCALGSRDAVGVVGLSRRPERPHVPDAPEGVTYQVIREGDAVLDSPAWLLRMHRILN